MNVPKIRINGNVPPMFFKVVVYHLFTWAAVFAGTARMRHTINMLFLVINYCNESSPFRKYKLVRGQIS